ncbi:MAG: hypothetical protein GC164_14045 [Phycisphaera sp.]|nr:hypothetical protein [Phycisphaera sp.]
MRRSLERREIEFRGTPGGALERVVKLTDGREYAHRCSKVVFEKVAAYLDEHPREGVKIQSLADALEEPMTQVNVALQLLTERGLLETHGRLGYVADGYATGFFEHAMTEFYALIEGFPPEFRGT